MGRKKIKDEIPQEMEGLLLAIDKKFGKGSTTLAGIDNYPVIDKISSGSIGIDLALSGGYGRGRMVEVFGPEASGKAQPLSSKILTPSGWTKMGNIKVGDIICTPDGGESTVVGIFPQGKQDVYEIILDDKSKTHCTADHLWSVTTRYSKLNEVLTTQQLLDEGIQANQKRRKFKIPNNKPLKFNTQNLPINPYLLGLLLGDGGFSGTTIKITTADDEILNSIKNILSRDCPECILSHEHGKYTYNIRNKIRSHKRTKIRLQLEEFGLADHLSPDKFIPDIYLIANIQQREALLQGLIDTDGSVGKKGTIEFTTTSKQLSKQFIFLCRSLGIRCTTSSRVTKYTSSTGNRIDGLESYRSNLLLTSMSIQPAKLTRKANRIKKNKSKYSNRFIESIKLVDRKQCQCIQIGHPDQLYITDDFIVTHNTTGCLHVVAETQKIKEKAAFIDVEHALDFKYAENLGVCMDDLVVSQPDSGEQALEILDMMVRSGIFATIILDSVAALVPKAELEGEMGASHVGLQARMMSQACRKLAGIVQQSNTLVIFTNQIRYKVGILFGSPETVSGGNALKFYASQRLDFRRRGIIKDGETPIGNTTEVKVIKNKIGPPFRRAEVDIIYGKGIDWAADLLNVAIDHDLVERSGAWIKYQDKSVGQGVKGGAQWLRDNPKIAKELREKIINPSSNEEEEIEEPVIEEADE